MELAFLAVDRHTGIIRDFLAGAGETIEESGLAAIGVADQR
jgi:hypothetical protein